jgi:hypothetical protein
MSITRVFLVLSAVLLATIMTAAQRPAPKFTSVYTSLGSGCRVLRGKGGTDDASLCPGAAGYQVRIYASATMTHIAAEEKAGNETFALAAVALDFNESKSRIEWRLANGKPFAAILRVPKYADGDLGVGKIIGEELVVVGLKGLADLSTSIDAKTRGANSLAREVADSAYLAR